MTYSGDRNLEQEFNERAGRLAQYQMAFDAKLTEVRPNQVLRAFTAVMMYPVPATRPSTTESEKELVTLGIAISELKTEMATLSAAMQQLEDQGA